jgi:dihydrodipicolinate synthase/N-acetylneuraminate lyase
LLRPPWFRNKKRFLPSCAEQSQTKELASQRLIRVRDFGLQGFTSGSVCIAPRGSMEILKLIKAARYDEAQALRAHYLPLEDLRDSINPIRTLHEAVTLAGIADMGPILPTMSNIEPQYFDAVREATSKLLAWDRE